MEPIKLTKREVTMMERLDDRCRGLEEMTKDLAKSYADTIEMRRATWVKLAAKHELDTETYTYRVNLKTGHIIEAG